MCPMAHFLLFVLSEYQVQHGKCRYQRRDGNGDADFEKVEIPEFEVVLFENGAPHNACEGADGGKVLNGTIIHIQLLQGVQVLNALEPTTVAYTAAGPAPPERMEEYSTLMGMLLMRFAAKNEEMP